MGERRKMISPLLKKLLKILVIVLIVGLLVEGAARLLLSSRLPEPAVPTEIGQFDERLGWSKIPNTVAVSSRTGVEIEYRINSKGLRDEETSYEKPEDTFRIVVIGDSFTFGFGVPIKQHYSVLLEGYFENVEVINMGVDGFGVDQALLYLQLEGFKYEPDLVLAYVPGFYEHRHMHATRFGKSKPRFLLVDDELVLTNSPVKDNLPVRPVGFIRKVDYFIVEHSLAYNFLRGGILNLIRPAPTPIGQRQEDSQNSADESFMDEMRELGLALILEMQKDSLEHGAEFVLVTNMSDLHSEALEKGILSLDVTAALANPAFSLPDSLKHINESGNGVLAWEIARYLQSEGLISE